VIETIDEHGERARRLKDNKSRRVAGGRKLAITVDPKLLDRICDLLRQGCSIRTTCECVGLSQSCFFEYMRRSNPDAIDHEPRFLEFAERVTRARGEGKAELIARIRAAGDWHADLALLERISPAEYCRTVPNQSDSSLIGGDDGGTIHELLLREAASRSPDPARIERLKKTLDEVRAANAELSRLVREWTAEPYDKIMST
jgi:hypothetical protein